MLKERQRRRAGDRSESEQHRAERQGDGEQVIADEAALFLLLIGDIESGQHRRGAVRSPIGPHQEGDGDAETLGLLRCPDRIHQLVADNECDVGREHGSQRAHMLDNGERIGGDPIDQHHQPQKRQQREEAVEGDSGRDEADIVVPHALVRPLGNILPRGPRHLPRRACVMSLGIDHRLQTSADRRLFRDKLPWPVTNTLAKREKQSDGGGFQTGAEAPLSRAARAPAKARRESRMGGQPSKGTRVIALVGPAGAGKTSLAEAMLFAAGATDRLGSTANGSSIGDSSPEARQRGGSTELNLYHFQYLGDDFAIIDVPGSVGFSADGAKALAIADVAIVVVDPDPSRAPLAAPALRALDELGIPHLIFVNRIDQAHGRIRDLLSALQPMSVSPLIRRQIPIWDGEKISGFVDLALEYAFKYRPGQASERIDIPADLQAREAEARTHMLEQLADHDDELLEQLLMDEAPAREKVLQDLARETGDNLGVSVLFGSASSSWGVRRLLKAMRHEAPDADAASDRLGVSAPALYVFKIIHGSIGRLALARALGGRIAEGTDLKTDSGEHARVGSLFKLQGEKTIKVGEARSGDLVAVAKIDSVKAGQWLGSGKLPPAIEIDYPARNCAIAIEPADRK